MKIPPIFQGNKAEPYPSDWQQLCDSMMMQVTGYLKAKDGDQCDGYLSTVLAFANGLGSSPEDQKLQAALDTFFLDVRSAYQGGPSTWIQDLQSLRSLFPNNLQQKDIEAGFKNALSSVSQIWTGRASGDYASGFGQMIHDLLPFATQKITQILTSKDFLIQLNNFVKNPDEDNEKSFVQEIQHAIASL